MLQKITAKPDLAFNGILILADVIEHPADLLIAINPRAFREKKVAHHPLFC